VLGQIIGVALEEAIKPLDEVHSLATTAGIAHPTKTKQRVNDLQILTTRHWG
jgi:hypothetical protein